jgi:hypothetical protein
MLLSFILAFFFVLIPATSFAWGPLTHMYLGSEIFYLGGLLPTAVYGLIKKYRQDYLYGNIMADAILAKKYLPTEKHSHNWSVAVDLLESSRTKPEEAFSMGFMSHLAADTVAHGSYTAGCRGLEHSLLEFRADSTIDHAYWLQALSIRKKVQARNDSFLEKSLERAFFSFKTNRRIFKGFVALSGLNRQVFGNTIFSGFTGLNEKAALEGFHTESIERIVDVLSNGTRSEVLKKDPVAKLKSGWGPTKSSLSLLV